MLSICCGAVTEFTEIGICPECKEHCDFEDDEQCPECDGKGCNECIIILQED
jgi:hypothetical protein